MKKQFILNYFFDKDKTSLYNKYEIHVNNIIPYITKFKLNTCEPYNIK